MPDKMPGISDKIPDNQPNLDVCHVSETLDNQESQPLCLTDSYFQEGGGVNDSVRQVENITQSEDTTIGVEPEPLTLPGLKTRGFLRFHNLNILFAQVPRLSTFAQKCVLIPPVALIGETPRPHWLIFWAFSC